ncbi:MAG: PQQ-dependent sugar dehydrogenase [Methylotenera sp.]
MFEAIFAKLSAILTIGICSIPAVGCAKAAEISAPQAILNLSLPTGFHANIFAKLSGGGSEYFTGPRMLAFDKNGNLFVSLGRSNQVVMLPDANRDGLAEAPVLVSDKLNAPNGLAFVGDDLLVANQDSVVKLTQKNGAWSAPKPLIKNLPSGGHTLKTIKVGPDNFLYINVGSSCNVCVEEDPLRATILRYTLEGEPAGGLETVGRHAANPIWTRGLRNSQGFAWHPKTGSMFATNDGADMRSDKKGGRVNDELPPEHFNKIEPGKHYGWPHCWGNPNNIKEMVEDPNFAGPDNFCKNSSPPTIIFTSHSTPIGVTFLNKTNFPAEYKNDAIVALHGSWNREKLSGYKLVRVKFNGETPVELVDFATGWLNNNKAWGRPVDVIIGPEGALYVSDDRAGLIYRISYTSNNE